jgi:hypothetical protein
MLLNNETGKLYICNAGGGGNGAATVALGAEGDRDFIKRFFNLCENFEITKGKLHKLYDGFFYVLSSDKKILAGFKKAFLSELLFKESQYKYLTDPEDPAIILDSQITNERELKKKSIIEAEKFVKDKIEKKKFLIASN